MKSNITTQSPKTFDEVMYTLESLGTEQTRKIWRNHGAREPMFGVKIGDMKKYLVNTHTRNNTPLALALYNTGNCDAMYLAGLIVNPQEMTKQQIHEWAKEASWYMISEYTVASVCANSKYALELVRKWIAQKQKEHICTSGWSAYSHCIIAMKDISHDEILRYLEMCKEEIHHQHNRVRYTMNNFIISVGSYIPQLTQQALDIAKHIGKVEVYMENTSCKVPNAYEYIQKVRARKKIYE